jgi:hypothetical protein
MDDDFDDALSALTHEIRVAIVRELADADRPLPFTELKSRVDVRDAGRFNYHLTELCQHYVRDTPDGYELNHRGERVVIAADAGVETTERSTTDDSCPVCGEKDCSRLIHVHLNPPARR